MSDISDEIARRMNEAMRKSAFTTGDYPITELSDQPGLSVKKYAVNLRISREFALDFDPDTELTPEEQAERKERLRRYDLERKQRVMLLEGLWGQLFGITEPAIRALVKLHALTYRHEHATAECDHCYDGGDMGDHADWPCDTVQTIAAAYEIEVPA